MKDHAVNQVVEKREVPEKGPVLKGEVIFFARMAEPSEEYFFRRVEIWEPDKGRPIVFLTNHKGFGPTTIARIYKDRWQEELFFKALKQNLKIKTFVGTSANAVRTQIWMALIAMLVLRYLQLKATFGWSLSNLTALLRQQLFVYRDLKRWLNEPFEAPPALAGVPSGQHTQATKVSDQFSGGNLVLRTSRTAEVSPVPSTGPTWASANLDSSATKWALRATDGAMVHRPTESTGFRLTGTIESFDFSGVEFIEPDIAVAGAVTALTGDASSGKSTLASAIAWRAHRKDRSALVLDRENPIGVVRDRFSRLGIKTGPTFITWGDGTAKPLNLVARRFSNGLCPASRDREYLQG